MNHNQTIDAVCASLSVSVGATCLAFIDLLPIIVQLLSVISLLITIAWGSVKLYDRLKK